MTPVRFIVTACEGREATTAETMVRLYANGGGHRLRYPIHLHWTGPTYPPFDTLGAHVIWWKGARGENTRASYWRSLKAAFDLRPDADLVTLEDDVSPALNALPYIERLDVNMFTTFFNTRGWEPGPHQLDNAGFWGTQCVRIPSRVIARLVAENPNEPGWLQNPSNPKVSLGGLHGADIVLGFMLRAWGEPVFQHRTIVQHVGAQSLCTPGSKLVGIRTARDYVGDDFDCMELLE